jgi:hypothetical protein
VYGEILLLNNLKCTTASNILIELAYVNILSSKWSQYDFMKQPSAKLHSIPKDPKLDIHRRENVKSYNFKFSQFSELRVKQ